MGRDDDEGVQVERGGLEEVFASISGVQKEEVL